MDNLVAGCQPPAGAIHLLRFGLPSPPGVVGMVMAPGSASRKHPFYVVCKCGLGCCVCGGRRVGVGVWGCGPLVMLHVRALFVGGGGCVWVKCPCGGSGPHPGSWVLGWCWCSRRAPAPPPPPPSPWGCRSVAQGRIWDQHNGSGGGGGRANKAELSRHAGGNPGVRPCSSFEEGMLRVWKAV